MSIGRVLEAIPIQNQHDLTTRLQEAGFFRGLFDQHCDEWKRCPIERKVALIRELMNETQMKLRDIVSNFKYEYRDRPDIAYNVDQALAEILEHLLSSK
jgi:hypothetical protein